MPNSGGPMQSAGECCEHFCMQRPFNLVICLISVQSGYAPQQGRWTNRLISHIKSRSQGSMVKLSSALHNW